MTLNRNRACCSNTDIAKRSGFPERFWASTPRLTWLAYQTCYQSEPSH